MYDRMSIVIAFVVIASALGVLAWRSYQLSVHMEKSLDSIAAQYLAYAAEVTARRADANVRNAMSGAWDEWQESERAGSPTYHALRRWVEENDWIMSAIYVPDASPEDAIYVNEQNHSRSHVHMQHEFYTANGTVRYVYDRDRLLAHTIPAIKQEPMISATALPEGLALPAQTQIELIPSTRSTGLVPTPDGYAVFVHLAAPFEPAAIRASVRIKDLTAGWENHRIISMWLSFAAFSLLFVGTMLAVGGVRKESEAMKLRGALIANVSHELRTPLAMIRLGAETLKRGTKLAEADRAALQESILREVIHLNHLVENVLDVARLQRGSRQPALSSVYPDELVNGLLETYHSWIESKGFALEAEIDETIDEQMWDRDAVSRALLNLIDNAVKYSADDKRVGVKLRETGTHIEIAVEDHGIGIPSNEVKRIFEPYYRASFSDTQTRRGAGLGLTLVYQIMKSHGGSVELDSTPGEGSTFRLLFPKNGGEASAKAGALLETREA
jgi:Osmosensitive K+ channel histidine kinase